jgi:hypothetical protein
MFNFAKSLLSSDSRPIPSTVYATAFTCLLPRSVGGFDTDDYNTPKPPVYRVIVPSQNRNGCFLLANQHSLLPASPLHACSAARTSTPRDGARACTGMRHAAAAAIHAVGYRENSRFSFNHPGQRDNVGGTVWSNGSPGYGDHAEGQPRPDRP